MSKQIRVSNKIPPIYEELRKKFDIDWEKGIIIAYDGVIYSKDEVPPQKIIHEMKHLDRQTAIGNEAWWRLYLESEEFRKNEEAIAYMAEANFIKKNIKNREIRFFAIRDIAQAFASSIYGDIISLSDALKILR